MWLLESLSHVLVAGPFKSQAEMAKKLGVSQQYVNRQIKKQKFIFYLDGQQVIARRDKEFVGGGKCGSDKEELALRLGVSKKAVEKVLAKNSSGLLETPQGEVKIQKLNPGEKSSLPAVRVLWNDDTEKQDFVSFAAAAKELKLHPKTISRAIKAGRDSFTRKSDGKKFTFEIPAENTPSRKKPKPLSEKEKNERARRIAMKSEIMNFYSERVCWGGTPSYQAQVKHLEKFWPEVMEEIRERHGFEKERFYRETFPSSQLSLRGESEDEEDDFRSVSQTAIVVAAQSAIALPSKLGGYAKPVDEDPLDRLYRCKLEVEAQILKYMRFLPREEYLGMAQYQDAKKQLEQLERREELYCEMRRKYAGWWLTNSVSDFEKTKTVLFNPQTGEDVSVKNYNDIANYFLSNGYVNFLSPEDCDENWDCGRVEFPAQKVLKEPEETQEIAACEAITREEIREEARERTTQEKTVQENVQDGILQRVVVETETTERATVQTKITQKVTVEKEPLSTVWWWLFTFLELE